MPAVNAQDFKAQPLRENEGFWNIGVGSRIEFRFTRHGEKSPDCFQTRFAGRLAPAGLFQGGVHLPHSDCQRQEQEKTRLDAIQPDEREVGFGELLALDGRAGGSDSLPVRSIVQQGIEILVIPAPLDA